MPSPAQEEETDPEKGSGFPRPGDVQLGLRARSVSPRNADSVMCPPHPPRAYGDVCTLAGR